MSGLVKEEEWGGEARPGRHVLPLAPIASLLCLAGQGVNAMAGEA